jgi:hypothetical protein
MLASCGFERTKGNIAADFEETPLFIGGTAWDQMDVIGPEQEIDERSSVQQTCFLLLRDATGHGDTKVPVFSLELPERIDPFQGSSYSVFSHGTGVHNDEISLINAIRMLKSLNFEQVRHKVRIVHVHLATERKDMKSLGHSCDQQKVPKVSYWSMFSMSTF